MDSILIITTGGTIDKVYFDAKSQYEVGPPNITRVLAELNLSITYRFVPLMRKDSLDMTDSDRALIYQTIDSVAEERILITHGTDTMIQTAKHLVSLTGRTIVLTGALEPALFKTSDALFNIGCGLGALQTLDQGVYIAMNGRIFNCLQVRKDLQKNRFVALDE